jgi:hypothetical protein
MMEYPRFVFISPGLNKCPGGSFDCELVHDALEQKAALDAGFSDTVPEALEAYKVAKEAVKPAEIVKEPVEVEAARRGRPPKAVE